MASTPLSHHDILALVEPFTRRGRHVDLPASDRLERRLRFKPVEHAGGTSGEPALLDTLQLDSFESGGFRLTRTLSRCDSLQATLQVSGPDPAALLAQVEGTELREMNECEQCCGFGGAFALKFGEISSHIAERKCEMITASGADAVVLGDLGCMLNIEGRLRRRGDQQTQVLHVAEVLAGKTAG